MLTLALLVSASIDSCFGHLGFWTEPLSINTAKKCYSVLDLFLHFAYVKYLDQCNSLTKVFVRTELLYGSFSVLTHSVYIVANSDNVLHNFS